MSLFSTALRSAALMVGGVGKSISAMNMGSTSRGYERHLALVRRRRAGMSSAVVMVFLLLSRGPQDSVSFLAWPRRSDSRVFSCSCARS